MWEALNTISLSICRIMCELDHLLTHSISNILSCCKPLTTYWFLNLGNKIKVTGRNVGRVRWVLQFFRTLTGRLERCSSLIDTCPCRNFPIHRATLQNGMALFPRTSSNSL
ncbi:uncharacterized protein TNCV_1815871 [Trichonephila clavipes]|nr:uncharacterized protein TNCV_1815871 [Trichonephila clavipes]